MARCDLIKEIAQSIGIFGSLRLENVQRFRQDLSKT